MGSNPIMSNDIFNTVIECYLANNSYFRKKVFLNEFSFKNNFHQIRIHLIRDEKARWPSYRRGQIEDNVKSRKSESRLGAFDCAELTLSRDFMWIKMTNIMVVNF